jgi:hypothetical protein
MAVTVKKAVLWRREVDNQLGMLANTLYPLSEAGADLQVVTAYRYPGGENKAAIELHLVSVKSPQRRRKARGSPHPASLPCGSRATIRPGLGHAIAKAIGDAGST